MNIALVGNPNSGKTALFNRLTGASHKVANYAGVTVEKKEGTLTTGSGVQVNIIDLPGTYSLQTLTPDEAITREVLQGLRSSEATVDSVVLVTDATNLRRSLQLVLEVKKLGYPAILVLNMMDIARKRGLEIDTTSLSDMLGMAVVETVAVRSEGIEALVSKIEQLVLESSFAEQPEMIESLEPVGREQVNAIYNAVIKQAPAPDTMGEKIDAIVLHPVLGYIILAAILFGMFQAVYSLAELPMELIEAGIEHFGELVEGWLPEGMLQSLVVDGIIAGVGSVVVFLPQILILFFFILVLEESGYLPRAAFLLDRVMRTVGLSGRAFIPLLSCFACAIPGIMASRTIPNRRDRLATILIAPLMTCSARLPVYALLIGAFIPDERVGIFNLQGLVLFGLYIAGILSAMLVAWLIKLILGRSEYQPLMMELPAYHLPNLRNLYMGLWERARIFLTRAGTIILALMVLLWLLSSFPAAPEGVSEPAIRYSLAGQAGRLLEYVFGPIGFNWQIAIAMIPGMAAREASVAALGTVYALSASGDELTEALSAIIAVSWSLPTALSLLAWYVFAPQCIPMIIVTRRETNSWKIAAIMTAYLFALAYTAAFLTYRISLFLSS